MQVTLRLPFLGLLTPSPLANAEDGDWVGISIVLCPATGSRLSPVWLVNRLVSLFRVGISSLQALTFMRGWLTVSVRHFLTLLFRVK